MFKIDRNYLLLSVVTFLAAALCFGQTTAEPVDLETILKNANEQTVLYEQRFRDLLAKEIRTFESFGKNGELKKRSVIESNFIVYQSERNPDVVSEFRDVVKIDGKPVSAKERTPAEFFSQIERTGSVEKELEKIRKESLRFDKTLEIEGLTLLQGAVLAENLRPFFEFKLVGEELIDTNLVHVVAYRQTRPSPFVLINEKAGKTDVLSLNFSLDLPGWIKKTDVFLSGQLWLDAATFQLRREIRQLSARTARDPVPLLTTEFEYTAGDYGFLVPKHITLVLYNLKNYRKDPAAAITDTQVSFEYSNFTRTKVEIEILDEDSEQ